jgi:hypothetical protein
MKRLSKCLDPLGHEIRVKNYFNKLKIEKMVKISKYIPNLKKIKEKKIVKN